MSDPADLSGRVAAALAGALLGEVRVGTPTGAEQLLAAAESLAGAGGVSADDLLARGLGELPAVGQSGVPIRGVAAALLTPRDRPALRRNATALAQIAAGADFGAVAVTLATGVLALDLLRFDLQTALLRLHQTLLEDAPILVLRRLAPLSPEAVAPADTEAGATLQLAITALAEATGVEAVGSAVLRRQPAAAAAVSLAAALAGLRGDPPVADQALAHDARVAAAAATLGRRAAQTSGGEVAVPTVQAEPAVNAPIGA